MTTAAVAPPIIMAVAAVAVGIGLNYLETKYKIKAQVIDALKATSETVSQGLYYVNTQTRSWIDQTTQAIDRKANAAGRAIHQGLMDWLCPICRKY